MYSPPRGLFRKGRYRGCSEKGIRWWSQRCCRYVHMLFREDQGDLIFLFSHGIAGCYSDGNCCSGKIAPCHSNNPMGNFPQPLRTIMNYQYRFGTTFREATKFLYSDGGYGRYYRGVGAALIQGT